METISVLDDSAKELIESCLSTPTILRQTLRQFSNSQLLTLSLVNKQWNFEARSVLRGRGNLIARLSKPCTCQTVVAFASDLEKMRVVPFSGIHVVISHPSDFQPSSASNGPLDSSYGMILDRLPCKIFSLSFLDTYWKNCKDCQALVLITRIMEAYCGTIETFSLTLESDYAYEEMFEQVFQHQHLDFPQLKTFKIQMNQPDEGSLTTFAKTLVSHAPNLQELHFAGAIMLEENVLEGSMAVLVPGSELDPLFGHVCESMISSVRAEKIVVLPHDVDFEVDVLDRVLPILLEASRNTVHTLGMDLLFAVPLMCYGICLENVTKLEIYFRSDFLQRAEPTVLSLLNHFDITRVFPKLENVKIHDDRYYAFAPHHISRFVEQGNNAAWGQAIVEPAFNIKHLILRQISWISTDQFWFWMFPNVIKLSIDISKPDPTPFAILWEKFIHLKELSVTIFYRGSCRIPNLDSVFCGIFPEEVAELEGKDDEYLKAVNIVPVMSSIRCIRGLRSFSLDLDRTLPLIRGGRVDTTPLTTWLFSKVTALIGFASCPGLAVSFATNSNAEEALKLIKPYMSATTKPSRIYGIQNVQLKWPKAQYTE